MERLIAAVTPHRCMGCGYEGAVLCDWCLPDFFVPIPSCCYRCMVYSVDSRVCASCRRKSRLRYVWVRTEYDEVAKLLVHGLKFERKQAAASSLARAMAESLPYLSPDTIVTHVPTASRRVRRRGYDQARLMAQALASHLGLSYRPLLGRLTQTRQVGAKRSVRLEQMKYAFVAVDIARPVKSVLLVDDLITTGATIEAAAACLRHKGVKTVSAAVFAQKR